MSAFPGPCADCCTTCPAPTTFAMTRSASKSKCGLNDSTQPGKYFLKSVESFSYSTGCSGTITGPPDNFGRVETDSSNCNGSANFSLTTTVNPSTCGSTCVMTGSSSENYSSSQNTTAGNSPYAATYANNSTAWTGTVISCGQVSVSRQSSSSSSASPSINYTDVYTSSLPSIPDCSCYENTVPSTTTNTTAYSNEYTTAMLESTVVAALSAWGTTFSQESAVASAELNSAATTYSIEQSKYYLAFPVPRAGLTYKLSWVERFTPDGGGAPTNTARSYTWDGTTPSNYNANDTTTWPATTIYEMDQPAGNGQVAIADLQIICGDGTTIQVIP